MRQATDKGCDLADLSLVELQALSGHIGEDVFEVLTVDGSMAARDLPGGTAPKRVRARAVAARAALEAFKIA